jgi:mannosylglycerate hydrolase
MSESAFTNDEPEHLRAHNFVPVYKPWEEFEPIKSELLEFYNDKPEVIADVIPGSHLDLMWYIAREPSKQREGEAMVEITKVDNFTLEQMVVIRDYLNGVGRHKKKEVLDMVAEGRMELVDMFVQPDKFLTPEQLTFWNFKHGRRIAQELGGKALDFEYIPDTFGFPASTPMMLRQAGKRTIVFMRGFEHLDTQGAFFWWKYKDGSKVLALPMQGGYANAAGLTSPPDVDRNLLSSDEYFQRQVDFATYCVRRHINKYGHRYVQTGIPHMPLMNGNDFTKPDKDLSHVLAGVQDEMRKLIPNFNIQTNSLANHTDLIHRSIAEKPEKITTYEGEMRSGKEHYVLLGTASTRMPLKQQYHDVGRRILDAGAATSAVLLGRKYANPNFNGKKLVDNEHQTFQLIDGRDESEQKAEIVGSHDTILGCGDDHTYDLTRALMTESYYGANQVVRNATAVLAGRHDTYGPYRHIERGQSIINLLNEPRTAYTEVPLQGDIEHATALRAFVADDGEEVEIPVQIVRRKDIHYAALALPLDGMSSKNVRMEPVDKAPEVKKGEFENTIENEFYSVHALPNGMVFIDDKRTGVQMAGLAFEDQGDRGDEYNFNPIENDIPKLTSSRPASVKMVNDGPVFTEMEIESELDIPKSLDAEQGSDREVETRSGETVTMRISTRVRLIKGIDRIEFSTTVNNTARDHRLRVIFDTPNAGETVRAKQPFGMIEREAVPIKGGDDWVEKPPVATSHHQGLLAVGDLAVMTRGLQEYEAHAPYKDGKIRSVAITDFRSVGYLSKGNLSVRGEGSSWAGPGTATPDAQLLGELPPFEYAISLNGRQSNSSLIHQMNDYVHNAENGFEGAAIDGTVNMQSTNDRAVRSDLYPTEDGQAAIISIYNPDDEATTVTLSGVFEHAVKCDAYGKPLDDADTREFELAPGMVFVRLS